MKFSKQLLQTYITETLPENSVIEQVLFDHAFEVEEIKQVADDTMIDINVLPDRQSDAGSHFGMARELAGLFGFTLKTQNHEETVNALSSKFSEKVATPQVTISTDKCRRYCTVRIDNVTIGQSPEWLKQALESVGQRSINNVVDATNYILMQTGQPTHVFDAQKISGTITIRSAGQDEEITLLTGETKKLSPANIVIAEASPERGGAEAERGGGVLALAGVKGGKKAEVTNETTSLVLESANFDAISVRKTARGLYLLTDAAKRFENNISSDGTLPALRQLAELILQLAGGEIGEVVDQYPIKEEKWTVSISKKRAESIIGISLSPTSFTDVFQKFNISYSYDNESEVLTVFPETGMRYLAIPEDLTDEIVRIVGYKNLESKLPKLVATESDNGVTVASSLIRSHLLDKGFNETFTYAFSETGDIKMKNALSDKSFLRTNISNGFINALDKNFLNKDIIGLDEIKMFEIGNVFAKEGEFTHLIFGIKKGKQKGVSEELTKLISELEELSQIKFISTEIQNDMICECRLPLASDLKLVADSLSYRNNEVEGKTSPFTNWSAYPAITRDISVWVPESVQQEELAELYINLGTDLLTRAPRLVDSFSKEGRTSYAFRLVFQSFEKTLTDDDVKPITDVIYAKLSEKGYETR